jgi:hypothetical protein
MNIAKCSASNLGNFDRHDLARNDKSKIWIRKQDHRKTVLKFQMRGEMRVSLTPNLVRASKFFLYWIHTLLSLDPSQSRACCSRRHFSQRRVISPKDK